jgi:hypothetical protein
MVSLRHAFFPGISIVSRVSVVVTCVLSMLLSALLQTRHDGYPVSIMGHAAALAPSSRSQSSGRRCWSTWSLLRERYAVPKREPQPRRGVNSPPLITAKSCGQHVHLRDSPMHRLSRLGKDKNLVGVAEARNERRYWVNLTRDRCKFVASERSVR